MQEIWKDIKNYEGYYQVSNLGNVKSLSRKIGNKYYKSKMLKKSDNRGYLQVQLWKHSNMKWSLIHRLVAEAFIPNPEHKLQVNHIDGNKSNNEVSNLEWVSRSENQLHSYHVLKTKPSMKGRFGKTHVRAVKVNQFDKNGNFIKTWDSIIEASKKVGIPACCITNCAKLRRKSAGNFIWEYVN